MCGRARLSSDVSEIKLVFSIPPDRPAPNFPPSWNVAPTDSLPAVRYDAKAGQRSLDMLRWGLIPYWAKDIKVGFANINARPRGSRPSPLFGRRSSGAAASCRSTASTNGKRPKLQAALCDSAGRPAPDGAGGLVGKLALAGRRMGSQLRDHHDRPERALRAAPQPHAGGPETRSLPVWLGEQPADEGALKALLAPFPSEEMTCWPVSARVGNVKNNDASLIEPIAA
jgi:putative SOS response-associated peptidase YedK